MHGISSSELLGHLANHANYEKDGGRIEDEPAVAEVAPGIATELYGGEGEDVSTVVMEDFEEDDAVRPETWLNLPELLPLLLREKEVEAANRKGRRKPLTCR